jgi:enoyl-CoA hydratase
MSEVVLIQVSDRVAVVTLNRPEARNAMDTEVLALLPRAVAEADDDPAVDAIVLTGTDPAFCAGLDLRQLGDSGDNLRSSGAGRDPDQPARPFRRTAKPIIGAINGAAVTGGLELALRCDFLVASERARFADTHARVGVMPAWGLTVLLPQAIGLRRAKEMSLTGNFVGADEALALGLVNHVVPHDRLLDETCRIARDIASADPTTARALLASYDRTAGVTAEEGLRLETHAARAALQKGFDPAEVARRRDAIVARGRDQVRSDASPT